jgi:hypothetical protein
MDGWQQRRLGPNTRDPERGRGKTPLTLTGLLIKGV